MVFVLNIYYLYAIAINTFLNPNLNSNPKLKQPVMQTS